MKMLHALFILTLVGIHDLSAQDNRPLRNLNTSYFPMDVEAWERDWEMQKELVRKKVMLSAGLWPLPEKTPLNSVIHGRVERADYTIDRVYFESFPGHYVTGNLYLPKPLPAGKLPAVLCPHGHWQGGRFMDYAAEGDTKAQQELVSGAEHLMNAARSPLQARCVHLARMGCAVFHWDTLGNADSIQISDHRSGAQEGLKGSEKGEWGFYSTMADLNLQTNFGLQVWNSIRALDFIASLPYVDTDRLAVTGASGGATQTMMLTAIDSRMKAAFPCVMVSTAMQGGCTCENSHFLRIGQGNVDIAAAAAPRPLGMTTADDWTVEFDKKGYPDLKNLYQHIGKTDEVSLLVANQFKHNYNEVSRAAMYAFMKQHLNLGDVPLQESDFVFSNRDDLTVWTLEHPAPSGVHAGKAHEAKLMQTWADLSQAAISDEARREAWTLMVSRKMPVADMMKVDLKDHTATIVLDLKKGSEAEVVTVKTAVLPQTWAGKVIIDLSGDAPSEENVWVLQPELYLKDASENPTVDEKARQKPDSWNAWSGYTYGYNPPLLIRRVHDVLSTLAALPHLTKASGLEGEVKEVTIYGKGEYAAIAALAMLQVDRDRLPDIKLNVDPADFSFASLSTQWDTAFVPGAVKYGDITTLIRLANSKGSN